MNLHEEKLEIIEMVLNTQNQYLLDNVKTILENEQVVRLSEDQYAEIDRRRIRH